MQDDFWRVAYNNARATWLASEEASQAADAERGEGDNTTELVFVPSSYQRQKPPTLEPPIRVAPGESWRVVLNNAQAIRLSSQEASRTTGVELQKHPQLAGIPDLPIIRDVAKYLHAWPKISAMDQKESQMSHFPHGSDADGDAVTPPSPELRSTCAHNAGWIPSMKLSPPDNDDRGPLGKGEVPIYFPEDGRGRSPQRNLKRHYDGSPVKKINNACRSQSNMRGRSKFRKADTGTQQESASITKKRVIVVSMQTLLLIPLDIRGIHEQGA
ncbi:hypothetical protein LTR70_000199 [Exophiala xenobiotica]|uniref:Uncharacterized protein n=1 Tax=Lithohypha guttulata TaxID=1690604 RepID=A0ABR0KPE1_9EURO|nr:hypothetical protein LTR24_000324 [Lithohypha guttulata]KAK5330877.1 hypothetical protein LTR70_000199 [Exophiala xenobiotica]